MKKRIIALVSILIATCCACKRSNTIVVRVYDKELSLSELQAMLPAYSANDSIALTQQHLQGWIQEQVMLHEAEHYLTPGEMNFDHEIENYRNALTIHAFETKYLNNHVTKNMISQDEILAYYKTHPDKFMLAQNAIKLHFIKFSINTPNIEKAQKLFFKTRTAQEEKQMENICMNNAENYYMQNQWLLYEDILKEIPLTLYNETKFKNGETELVFNDSDYIYMVQILDFKTKETLAPLSIVQNNITDILLKEKQVNMLNQLRTKAMEKAQKNGEILY